MEDIILIGGGGHCKSVIDVIERQGKYSVVAILDRAENMGKTVCGYTICNVDEDIEVLFQQGIKNACITLGSIGNCTLREKLYKKAKGVGFFFPVIIDPSAVISKYTSIGEGTFIGKGTIINTDSVIDEMSIINTGAIIEHECKIGKFGFISVGVNLSGNVTVGAYSHIGTGASIVEGKSIGENCLIGAGSVVVTDIDCHTKAFGNPCRRVDKW